MRLRRCEPLRVLCCATGAAIRRSEARTVEMARIVGTVARCCDFDACFRPLRPHLRHRLNRLRRHRPPRPGAPVVLLEAADGYYVVDGHHRIALARERGQVAVDAHVHAAGAGAA